MSVSRDWFWQILELGQGPDYNFIATFAESDAERLAAFVHQHLPPAYIHNTDFILSGRRGEHKIYASYLDRHTHDRLVEMQSSGKKESIWYNGEIEVRDHELYIENVLGAGTYNETGLITALALAPDLTIQKWRVTFSGYSWGEVAHGSSAAELLAYLQ